MIEWFQFPRDFGMPNNSPFCMRVETFLKLAAIPYKLTEEPNPRKSPKGKLPAIVDDGKVICDNHFIIDYLTDKHQVNLDHHMSDEEKAIAHGFKRMLCEHFYWVMGYGRFADPAGWLLSHRCYFLPNGYQTWYPSRYVAPDTRKSKMEKFDSGTTPAARDRSHKKG